MYTSKKQIRQHREMDDFLKKRSKRIEQELLKHMTTLIIVEEIREVI